MTSFKIQNLQIIKISENILLLHQKKPPFYFSCSDGLIILPKKGRNSKAIVLDANIESHLVKQLIEKYGPVSNYVCTHGHMDHIAHVHAWEQCGAIIHAPHLEGNYLKDLKNFYEGFGFNEAMDFSVIEKFGEINRYHECNKVSTFKPGDILKFENFEIQTIPFLGHSKSHVGFFLPKEKILHVSCLGFDQSKPGSDGFGPWYGFKECSILQYMKDIDRAEALFLEHADKLTSSHAYIVNHPDTSPFDYMRNKIESNQARVDKALMTLGINSCSDDILVKELLKMDLFFPKRKMKGFLLEIYTFWEAWIIRKHVRLSKTIKN